MRARQRELDMMNTISSDIEVVIYAVARAQTASKQADMQQQRGEYVTYASKAIKRGWPREEFTRASIKCGIRDGAVTF